MKTVVPDPPVIRIDLLDDNCYGVSVTMNGVRLVFAADPDYQMATRLAEGIGYGIELTTNVRSIHDYPLTESLFISRLPDPAAHRRLTREYRDSLLDSEAAPVAAALR